MARNAADDGAGKQKGDTAMNIVLHATLTCPHCGARSTEPMPTDACCFYFDCKACGRVMRPKPGDCCVFCSYGSTPCPPRQKGTCCSGT